ncbi:MAG: hypothetical protein K0S47_365 [Herbinix sp.]|nr:hypothetical protein [Herbinix sp.]
MFEQLNKNLEELSLGILRYQKINELLNQYALQLAKLNTDATKYADELKHEQSDVEELSRTSLKAIFYSVLSSKEKQLNKERQEVLAAKLKYDNILVQINEIEKQITKLKEEQCQYSDYEARYNNEYKVKYQMLKQSGKNADRITALENVIISYKSTMKEIDEAINAGNQVLHKLKEAEDSLDSAEGWGMWDMFGGGLIADMVKHSHIDDAKSSVLEIQVLLNRFRTELADIKITSQITIDIDGFAKFADFFFDGLISDWIVQSRINDSISSVRNVQGDVNSVLTKLRQMMQSVKISILQREDELRNLIEKA